MKFPIRILLVALLAIANSNIFAQSMRYGIVAGLQLSHIRHTDSRLGFTIGMKGEYDFSDNESNAYLDFELLLSAKGWKDKLPYAAEDNKFVEWKCRLYYIEVPVHIGYKHTISKSIKLLADIGPYFAIGLSGENEFKDGKNSLNEEIQDEGNPFKNDMYKRFDVGAGTEIGIEISQGLQITTGYKISLMKPTKGRWDILSLKDRTLELSIAYMF